MESVRVASIPEQIQTHFVSLATLFQGTLKTAASRHKCGETLSPPPKQFAVRFRRLKMKPPPPLFPFVLVARDFLK